MLTEDLLAATADLKIGYQDSGASNEHQVDMPYWWGFSAAAGICCFLLLCNTRIGNNIFDHSDVAGATPVGAALTRSSFSIKHMASMDLTKTTARRDDKHLGFYELVWLI